MEKRLKIILTVISIVVILGILNLLGLLAVFNWPANYIVAGPPNKNCVSDSDCAFKSTSCEVCAGCGHAVNKNWNEFCPFYNKPIFMQVACYPCLSMRVAKCIDNKCQKIIQCPEDSKVCPDESTVQRNPDLGCDFDPCPET